MLRRTSMAATTESELQIIHERARELRAALELALRLLGGCERFGRNNPLPLPERLKTCFYYAGSSNARDAEGEIPFRTCETCRSLWDQWITYRRTQRLINSMTYALASEV